jgi:GH15 family glucan-1,4-alpha-glucosidase
MAASNRIGDYALIGDCHSAALVGIDGSIDWACFPRFDSPAVFCRVLDSARGGAFGCKPAGVRSVHRSYVEDTNVLTTTFECETGTLEVTDCMPVETSNAAGSAQVQGYSAILRRLRGLAGDIDVAITVAPRFEYGAFVPRFRLLSPTSAEAVGGADALYVASTRPMMASDDCITASWPVRAGDEVWVQVTWRPSHAYFVPEVSADTLIEEARRRLDATLNFWRRWMDGCSYQGECAPAVRRSALVLKALTYAPTGALLAAPTTSLPEEIGGARNWDYRYTWIRDATLTLISLFLLGFRDEAAAFKRWLERTGAGRPSDLQIMYGIGGERFLPELELPHLTGHRDSAPVRIGNGAVKQLQLDAYGQLLESAYLYGKARGELSPTNLQFLAGLADIVCERWQRPDHGIWEIRAAPRHYVHSKVNCWLALDRAVKLAAEHPMSANVAHWARERDRVRDFVLRQAAPDGWFQQAVGFPTPDAATLLLPALGFVPTTNPVVLCTIDTVQRTLEQDGLVRRYLAPDGLGGEEGAFLLCSFWLLDCLIHAGRIQEAEELLQQVLRYANDVGLFAEEVDVRTREPLGNFPQAFSHMALVLSCSHLTAGKQGRIPTGRRDYAELALDRLLAQAEKP